MFGVALFDDEGHCVYGTNTDVEGFQPVSIHGSATVRLDFPEIQLLTGRYTLDVAAHRASGVAYDYRLGALSFRVSSPLKEAGAVRMAHSWSCHGGIQLDEPASD